MNDYEVRFEGEGGEKGNEMQGRKGSLTPLWRFVTKLEGERGGGTFKFICLCHGGKPYSGSYNHMGRHLVIALFLITLHICKPDCVIIDVCIISM